MIGISKREIMKEYTVRELMLVYAEYAALQRESMEPKVQEVSAEDF